MKKNELPTIKLPKNCNLNIKLVRRDILNFKIDNIINSAENKPEIIKFIEYIRKNNKEHYNITIRGRHSNRKELFSKLNRKYVKNTQNDIINPLQNSEKISIYFSNKQRYNNSSHEVYSLSNRLNQLNRETYSLYNEICEKFKSHDIKISKKELMSILKNYVGA